MAHESVLLNETIAALSLESDDTVLDATVNGGGHAKRVTELLGSGGTFIGLDADPGAIALSEKRLEGAACRVILEVSNFRELDRVLARHAITSLSAAYFDLGLSSNQLAGVTGARGFSFMREEPLLMTFGEPGDLTAESIVNEWPEESIANVLWGYGEERFSRRIARAIVTARAERPLRTTDDLVRVVRESTPTWYQRRRVHPATKTFQALRIAVNDELSALSEGLEKAWSTLEAEGRLAVITFHSLEDRIVKHFMRARAEQGARLLTKKPLLPSMDEQERNPRSRSAKLRILEKSTHEKQSAN